MFSLDSNRKFPFCSPGLENKSSGEMSSLASGGEGIFSDPGLEMKSPD